MGSCYDNQKEETWSLLRNITIYWFLGITRLLQSSCRDNSSLKHPTEPQGQMFPRTSALPREHVVLSQSQRCFGLPLGLISPGIDDLPQGYNPPHKNKDTLLGTFPEHVSRLVCTDSTQVWTHKLIVGGNRVMWAIPRINSPLILPLIHPPINPRLCSQPLNRKNLGTIHCYIHVYVEEY